MKTLLLPLLIFMFSLGSAHAFNEENLPDGWDIVKNGGQTHYYTKRKAKLRVKVVENKKALSNYFKKKLVSEIETKFQCEKSKSVSKNMFLIRCLYYDIVFIVGFGKKYTYALETSLNAKDNYDAEIELLDSIRE